MIVEMQRARADAPIRSDVASRERMEKNTYLPVHELDEDGEVDGNG